MDDKLALNEHERLTQIYTIRNANEERVKTACRMWQKYINIRTKNDTKSKRNRHNNKFLTGYFSWPRIAQFTLAMVFIWGFTVKKLYCGCGNLARGFRFLRVFEAVVQTAATMKMSQSQLLIKSVWRWAMTEVFILSMQLCGVVEVAWRLSSVRRRTWLRWSVSFTTKPLRTYTQTLLTGQQYYQKMFTTKRPTNQPTNHPTSSPGNDFKHAHSRHKGLHREDDS